jgi:hypothetical protein
MRQRATRVNPSEETIRIGPLGIRFLPAPGGNVPGEPVIPRHGQGETKMIPNGYLAAMPWAPRQVSPFAGPDPCFRSGSKIYL